MSLIKTKTDDEEEKRYVDQKPWYQYRCEELDITSDDIADIYCKIIHSHSISSALATFILNLALFDSLEWVFERQRMIVK